jgi:leader peptidase (prepilin peptidase)/N-methyltransferase
MPDTWTDFAIASPTLVGLLFAFAFGACAGSFVHVVAWRMPEGMSVVSPPSRCPVCGYRLPWYDNIPVLGWLRLRGRCAACHVAIPARYVLSEVAMGLLFAAVYAVLYLPRHGNFWWPVGQGWWASIGLVASLPALAAVLWAVGSLIAMLLCDARTFLIPVAIPTWSSVVAFVLWPIAGLVAAFTSAADHPGFPMPMPGWQVSLAATGALAGLAIGRISLAAGVLPRSFDDYDDYLANEGDTFADYPHARREMIKEIAFLGPAVLLGGIGALVARSLHAPADVPLALQAFFAAATGFVAAGALVWVVRIAATLLLGTEALGLGDVHLMAAAGAAFGWRAAVVGFFVAPFVGLAWWTVNLVRHAPMRMPFGPALAIGSIVAWMGRPLLDGAVTGALHAMSGMASAARQSPGGALAMAGLMIAVSLVGAVLVRRGMAAGAALAILAMVGAVVAWIFGAPGEHLWGVLVGLAIVACCLLAGVIVQPSLEPDSGPRTVTARVLRLLAFLVVVLGAFIWSSGVGRQPADSDGFPPDAPLQGP